MSYTPFRRGERLDAARMNKFASEIISAVRAGEGILVKTSKGQATVSLDLRVPRGRPSFFAKITAHTEDPGNSNRYTYEWEEVVKDGEGYGEWATKTGGRTHASDGYGPAYALHEERNAASGVQSGGIDIGGADYPGGFEVQPVPNDTIVRMEIVTLADGTGRECWFLTSHSAHDGTCSA